MDINRLLMPHKAQRIFEKRLKSMKFQRLENLTF